MGTDLRNLEEAARAAQQQTDFHGANAATFRALATVMSSAPEDPNASDERKAQRAGDIEFANQQADATERDYLTALAAEVAVWRDLDEARKVAQWQHT